MLLALPILATFANFQCRPTFYDSREREFFLQVTLILPPCLQRFHTHITYYFKNISFSINTVQQILEVL
jgi:hypothetical protein